MSFPSPFPFPFEYTVTFTLKDFTGLFPIITHLHGYGLTWTYDEVVQMLDAGQYRFYTWDGFTRAEIKVYQSDHGRFLKTVRDGIDTNNLTELPICR